MRQLSCGPHWAFVFVCVLTENPEKSLPFLPLHNLQLESIELTRENQTKSKERDLFKLNKGLLNAFNVLSAEVTTDA